MAKEKYLYETIVNKQLEEKITEIKEENGKKIEIVRTVKNKKPIKLAILEPRRKIFEGAEIFYAKQIAHYIQEGLLSRSLVAKRFANDGGILSEPEKKLLLNLREESFALQKDLFTLEGEDKVNKKNEIIVKITDINSKIDEIQNTYSEIFDNTVEAKARNKVIEWWVFHLALINEDETDYKPLFKGITYDEKSAYYDLLDEEQDEFINECVKKLSYLITFWLTANIKLDKKEFENMEKLYEETLSSYKLDTNEEIVIK